MITLPSRLTLPSGTTVQLRRDASDERPPVERVPRAPLFEEALVALTSDRVTLLVDGAKLDIGSLALRDFHVVRAVLMRSGVIREEPVEVSCRNCRAELSVKPCSALEVAPWADGEANDPELDTTLPFLQAIDVPPIMLGRVRMAKTVTFEERTVSQVHPLYVAASKERLDVNAELVRAMGIVALGGERNYQKIADALAHCEDEAFFAVGNAFLATHYVARLCAVVFCDSCGARNDVDAPYQRESGGAPEGFHDRESGRVSERALPRDRASGAGGDPFPEFEAFATRAHEIGGPLMDDVPGEPVELVVEGDTPAVDDGGEPLLGSYVPPHPGDASTPSQSPLVTVYYRTFRAMWNEDGPYDWDAELAETIEHELEHHVSFMRGDDPMDDDERAEIADEALRIVGRREAGRRAMEGFGASWTDFFRRTWPIWVLAVVALAFMLATQR